MANSDRLHGAAGDEPAAERGALTREQVVRAAFDLLDEVGLAGLSMRGLADRLGVRAASLYWHLRDKEQLLGLLSDAILGEVPAPEPGPWRAALDAFAERYRRVLLAHRDAATVVAGFQSGPSALRLYERVVGSLLEAGFAPVDAANAAVLLVGQYVPAFVAGEAPEPPPAAAGPAGGFAAPLGDVEWGQLRVRGGSHQLTIRSDPDLSDLFAARFEGRQPKIETEHGVVTISDQAGRRHSGDVALNAAVAWDVEIGGGARRLVAELETARLRSFTVSGGGSDLALTLGPPDGTVPVTFAGGLHRVTINRPPGTPLRIRVTSGVSRLALDEHYFGAVGGELRWQTPDFAGAERRYDLEVTGGANRLTIGTGAEPVPEPSAPEAPAARGERPGWGSLAAVAGYLEEPDMDARFRFGLTVLLDGLERRLPN